MPKGKTSKSAKRATRNRPQRIGIMGGTFDPIHQGHLDCARAACEALDLDQVLFIPAGVPVYKLDQFVTPAVDRIAMVRRAIKGEPRFALDTCEIDRGGKTYTADTLRYLRKKMPAGTEFAFIAGADAALTLPHWHESGAIAAEARIVAVTRPGYEVDETSAAYKELARDFTVDWIEAETADVSSSSIREKAAAGESLAGLVPAKVEKYIRKYGLYGCPVEGADTGDALSKAFYRARRADMARRVDNRRFTHVLGVAQTAKRLAEVYGQDPRAARLAGILHDWDKNYDDEGIRRRAAEVGLVVEPIVLESMPQTLHGMTASRALARDFPCIPADVLQAVDRHTTAAVGMTDLDMIVFIADCLEPSRRFGRCDELRDMVGKVPLEELFFQVHGYWLTLIVERGRTMHPDTIAIWNHYALRHKERRAKEREAAGLPPVQINPCAVSEKSRA